MACKMKPAKEDAFAMVKSKGYPIDDSGKQVGKVAASKVKAPTVAASKAPTQYHALPGLNKKK
jgi:hypothetical protein